MMTGHDRTRTRGCLRCPRACGADRRSGQMGRCGVTGTLKVARAMLHHWEEPPISGTRGSGAVFFSGCPLHCVYCQNADISDGKAGKEIDHVRLAEIFLELESQGAHNINLVTPTHYAFEIVAALDIARSSGLSIPIVYNTSGYESPQTLEMLAGSIDIYLTDFKYADPARAQRYSQAPDYPFVAYEALERMFEQVGPYKLAYPADEDDPAGTDVNLLERGVIVRHLMLPGGLEDSKQVVEQVYRGFADEVAISLMNQYTPIASTGRMSSETARALEERYPELAVPIDEDDYDELIDFALDLGVTVSFMQEGGTVEESFIPSFDCRGV